MHTVEKVVEKGVVRGYGVVDENGKIALALNPLTNKHVPEIYQLKSAAQSVANWYNSRR